MEKRYFKKNIFQEKFCKIFLIIIPSFGVLLHVEALCYVVLYQPVITMDMLISLDSSYNTIKLHPNKGIYSS